MTANLSPEERELLRRMMAWHSRCDGTPTRDLSPQDWTTFARLQVLGLVRVPARTLYRPPLWVDITEAGLAEARR